MKKMMLLAVMMAIAALMLAAAPASAQDDGRRVTICHKPGTNAEKTLVVDINAREGVAHLGHGDRLGACDGDGPGPGPGSDGGRDGDGRQDRDGDGFFDDLFDEPFINQDIEQECESGDIDQSFDVSQTGDNSNQTVGLQGTANTGCAQNVTNVVDAGNFGDFDNNDGNDGFFNDGFIICDFDNDGDNEECEDFNNNDDGFVFCDRDGDGRDDGDDDCVVVFPDFNDGGFFDDGDRFLVNGNDDGDIEIEDSGASITMSPTNTTNSQQEVNQAAAASAQPVWPWWSM